MLSSLISSLSWSDISFVFVEEVLQSLHLDGLVLDAPRLVEHVLVIQPAPLHSRGVLRAELLVPRRSCSLYSASSWCRAPPAPACPPPSSSSLSRLYSSCSASSAVVSSSWSSVFLPSAARLPLVIPAAAVLVLITSSFSLSPSSRSQTFVRALQAG